MRSVAVSVISFTVWLAVMMVLTIMLLRLHQAVETAQEQLNEGIKTTEGGGPADVAQLNERLTASQNQFNTVAIFLVGTIAFGLVVFTVRVYQLATAARDAQELVEFRGLVSAAAETPDAEREGPAEGPDLFGEEVLAERPRPKAPNMPLRQEEPAPRPVQPRVAVIPEGETIMEPALEKAFDSLAAADAERRHRLDALRRAGLDFPELSPDLGRLLELIGQPKTFMHQLVREISRHPVLAQKLVRLANTLYHSPPKPLKNLNFALVVLGAEGLRSAVLAQAVHETFDFSQPLQVELWHRSIAVAVAAGLVGRAVRHGSPHELYTLGLVHCLGRMVLLHNRPQEYAKLADIMLEERVPAAEIEVEAFGFTRAEAGAVAMALWGLPRRMQLAVLQVHNLDEAGPSRRGGEAVNAATILAAAAAIAKKTLGVGALPRDAGVDPVSYTHLRAHET